MLKRLQQKEENKQFNILKKVKGTKDFQEQLKKLELKKQMSLKEKEDLKKQKEEEKVQQGLDEPPIKKPEIIKRLRALTEPITLFGENDMNRYKRMIKLEQEEKKKLEAGKGNTF